MADTVMHLLSRIKFSSLFFGLIIPGYSLAYGSESGNIVNNDISWFMLIVGLVGGLALFLYGMDKMSEALRNLTGSRLKDGLAMLSNNRFSGLITGSLVTATIQSSSITTVMLVGFVSAGLMSFSQTISIILGSGIGTTITAQLVAFKVTQYSLLLIAFGFALFFISKKESLRQYGAMIMGLGMLFFGMGLMSESMNPLRTYQPFINLMAGMSKPLWGILAATIFTALIQSSAAAISVIIVLAMQGLISLEAGIALSLGANVGTCVTAGLASIGKPREAVRVAVSHVLFKIIGVVILFPFIEPFAKLIVFISPQASEGLTGIDAAASVLPRQVANAHTVFNVAIAIVFLPFTTLFARFITWIIPDKPWEEEKEIQPKFLNELLYHTPGLALDASRHEIRRMGKRIQYMNIDMMPAVLSGSKEELLEVRSKIDDIHTLYKHLVTYLAKISRLKLTEEQTDNLSNIMTAVNNLDHIGGLLEVNMFELGMRRIQKGAKISQQSQGVIKTLHVVISDAVKTAVKAVVEDDIQLAQKVIDMKAELSILADRANQHQNERLVSQDSKNFEAYKIEVEIISRLKRIYYHCKRMAKTVVEIEDDEKSLYNDTEDIAAG
ncbi:MAG: Na/Pi cotransporter family protein [Ignavibacteriae bacterium]|nr:Na/Pi cotransporter family protein [Ignavibacteriota bacterium]NOG99504.1 Na/Pi cotransporter family protein [Ignavibacteriota bacterium]